MELDLSLATVHKRNSNEGHPHPQPHRNSLEGFNPRVEWRETRSSYFLNVIFQGLSKDDIHLEMDNSRSLIIRGQRHLEEIGMVGWRWRLVEQGRPTSGRRARRPFRIPQDVNAGAITARFHHGTLHVTMPKLRRARFTPYHIYIRPSDHQDGHRPRPRQRRGDQHPHNAKILQGESADETMDHKTVLPRRVGEDEDVPIIITVEEHNTPTAHGQSVEVVVEACAPLEEPHSVSQDETKQQPGGYLSPMEATHPDDQHASPSSCSRSKEKDIQATKEDQDAHPSAFLYANLERICSGNEECSRIQTREKSQPSLCKCLCQLLACVGAIAACKLKR